MKVSKSKYQSDGPNINILKSLKLNILNNIDKSAFTKEPKSRSLLLF